MKSSNQLVNRLPIIAALIFAAALLAAPASRADIIYVSNYGNNTINKFDLATGADLGVFVNTGLSGPLGLAFDGAGNLYAANGNANTIEKFTPDGVRSVFASGGSLSGPEALAFDSAGNLFVANYNSAKIVKFTSGGVGYLFASTGLNPVGLAFNNAGILYESNVGFESIEKFTTNGVRSTFVGTGLSAPVGLAFDSADNLYVVNHNANTIEKITTNGVRSVFANTGLNIPNGLVFDSAGNLYVANEGDHTIEKFTPDGVGSVFANTGLNRPIFLAIQRTTTLKINMFAGLTIMSSVGTTNRIEYKNALSNTNWITLTNIVQPSSSYLFIDTDSPQHPQRYYRAVLLP